LAILSRPKISPQQRLDLEDFNALLSAIRTDAKLYTQQIVSSENLIISGFSVSGTGLKDATIAMANATFVIPQNTTDFSWFTSAPGEADIVIPDADLTDNTRNYIELELCTEDGTPLTKAFWDSEANSGNGAEFNQIVNTITDLKVQPFISTGGFSGSPDRLPLAIIDTDAGGNIKIILDRRVLMNRLAKPNDIDNQYTWGTKEEPVYTTVLTGVTGTFVAGEEVTINTETALVVTGGTTNITFNVPTGINFSTGDTITGTTSGATGTVDSITESFAGVDKSISTYKEMFDALMTEVLQVKGTRFWWQQANNSLNGITDIMNTVMVQAVADGSFSWDGSNFSITETNNGSPANTDIIGYIRIMGQGRDLELTRQDAASASIPVADGEVLFVKVPKTGDRSYSDAGSGDTNYQTVDIASFDPADGNYWIAYREGARLYVRGYGELEAGETTPISDPAKEDILNQIALNQAKNNQDRTLKLIEGGTWSYKETGSSPGGPIVVASNNVAHDGNFYTMDSASDVFAQSFTPGSNIDVTTVTVNLRKAGNPNWYARARIVADDSNEPDQLTELGTTSGGSGGSDVPMSTLPTDFDTQVSFTLDSPASLVSGTKYWIIISPFIGDGTTFGGANHVQTWYNGADNVVGETSSFSANNGSTWTNNISSSDLNFSANGTSSPIPGTNQLTISDNAYVQIPGLTQARNTIGAQVITFPNANSVAYIELNRDAGPAVINPVTVADEDSITLTDDILVIARKTSNGVSIGSPAAFELRDGEFLTLDGALSELNRLLNQLKITEHETDSDKARILTSEIDQLDGTTLNQVIGTFLLKFDGAVIDFTTGEVFESDGTTPLGIDFTPQTIGVGNYFWYGISLNADAVNALNQQLAKVNIELGSADDANAALAPIPNISGIVKLGWVQVQNNGGSIEVSSVRRLGPGSGSGGGGNGFVKVDYYNPVSTALPTGSTVTIDGQPGVDGDLVLFSNLASDNNRVYELSGVGSSILWSPVRSFNNQFDPTDGDAVIVRKGDAFSEQTPIFNGTDFRVNDVIRLFDGVSGDFWELGSIKSVNLINNTTDNVFTVTAAGSENIIVNYSIARGVNKETGQLMITSNGTDAEISRHTAFIGALGVTFTVQINSGDLELNYETDNQGVDAAMKLYLHRWSNSAGGPTGVPSYSAGGGGSTAAAGVLGDVQYHGGTGNLEADSRFKWDSSKGVISLDGLEIGSLKGPTTINDNIAVPATVITYPTSSYNFTVIEYSIQRGTAYRVGRLLIANSSTNPAFSDDSVEIGTTGVSFTVAVSGGNVEINYVSTSTGQTGELKYSMRQWA
jgi:hypothetical protein